MSGSKHLLLGSTIVAEQVGRTCRPGQKLDIFEKTQTQGNPKLKQKNSNSTKEPSKTQAIKLNYRQFQQKILELSWKNHAFASQNHIHAKISRFLARSL